MAAAAATMTAVSGCSKRDGDIASAACMVKKVKRARPPPPEELEVFFADAESSMARRFAAKYNYDVVKDAPMDGRYEWVRVGP